MRKAANLLIPTTLITFYYAFWIGLMMLVLTKLPVLQEFFPDLVAYLKCPLR